MNKKTNEDRILRVVDLATDHFGFDEVRFVGIKYDRLSGIWVAKLKMKSYEGIYESADSAIEAIRKLKKRIKKIIKRYNAV